MTNRSRRHHYIPKFLTKGFGDEKGLLFVYNKVNDEILKVRKSPKGIFFEFERNTIEGKDQENDSSIEDVFFKELDDKSATVVQKFQDGKINDELFSEHNLADLQFFIINLFWRIPKTDYAAKDLVERAEIKINGENISDEIRNHPSFVKLNRVRFFKETIEQFDSQLNKPKRYYIQVSEFEENLFLIGDYPIIYRNYMSQFTDLVQSEFKMAISSKRIISFALEQIPNFKKSLFLRYNATIIDQSQTYVASGDIKLLQASIEYYKALKEKGWNYVAKELLFRENTK
ncbi:DUF4238 domain-containing protein [Flavobacterium terrisoli]|uniref:DUF4238 domain-containing protein n=1 Tax=Flavobacterium terrisoli TaxID=3242195 RepID=UPI0025434885|nr:DUF4238 domain-containing protein [Flavobacterium buctense]